MNKSFFLIFACLVFAAVSIFTAATDARILTASLLPRLEEKELSLSEEDLAALIKPSVVRVVEYASGTSSIPNFKIDLEKSTVKILKTKKEAPIDFKYTGTGFVVSPEGYILTNAHLISPEMIKYMVITPALFAEVFNQAFSLALKDPNNKALNDEEKLAEFGTKAFKQIIASSTFSIERKVVVANPLFNDEKFEDIVDHGFPAEIAAVNDNFMEDDVDVGILKINEAKMPAAKLGDSKVFKTGSKVYVFGFPNSAQVTFKDFFESSFTGGVVNAIKDSKNKKIKYLQIDVKIAPGSSGGPLISEKGLIGGIITLQSDKQEGDSFAFAIPIEDALDFMHKNSSVKERPGDYYSHLIVGLELMQNKKCKAALEEFRQAKNINSAFTVSQLIEPYEKKCNDMIVSGASIDTSFEEWKARVGLVPAITWVSMAGGVGTIIIAWIVIVYLRRRMKKGEREMEMIEKRISSDEARQNNKEGVSASPVLEVQKTEVREPRKMNEEELVGSMREASVNFKNSEKEKALENFYTDSKINPEVANYIKEAKAAGMSEEKMRSGLRGAGWGEDIISKAFQ